MEPEESLEADIATVQDVEAAGLGDDLVEDEDIVDTAVGDPDKGRDGAP